MEELRASKAGLLVLLGDQPVKWFLRFYDDRWDRLSDFGTDATTYGRRHPVVLDGLHLDVLPLAHPRQVARLGQSSARWYELHREWLARHS